MIRNISQWVRTLRRARKSENGSASVEFVILFVPFMLVCLSSVEAGVMMTRHMMLERGVDMAVRQVRLGNYDPITNDKLKQLVCEGASIIPDCLSVTKVEMKRMDPFNWVNLAGRADCVDIDDAGAPLRTFENGITNDIMVIRVCSLFKPFFPQTGLGFQLPRESGDFYALVSTSAFVMEPQ